MNDQHSGKWEKRWHPLRRQWVVYAAHRNQRPWSFDTQHQGSEAPAYDPKCYLCPNNKRISGLTNPDYKGVYIFDNDHPVVGMDSPYVNDFANDALYKKDVARGIARVICYDARHDVTMGHMTTEGVKEVFRAMKEQTEELSKLDSIKSVFFFENKGEIVGVSNPHPHCQMYATDFTFGLVAEELQSAADYREVNSSNIFEDIITREQKDKTRVIAENQNAIAFVPFFARYAYEVMIFPKRRHATLMTLTKQEIDDLAAAYHEVIIRYDLNYNMDFPFVMSLLQAPIDREYQDYHLHLLIQPPLRQPGLQKFLAGPEIGGDSFMADTMPEEKAAELLAVDIGPRTHLLSS